MSARPRRALIANEGFPGVEEREEKKNRNHPARTAVH
jgi:hypothetical protein